MLKKIILIVFCLNFLQGCGFVPMYSTKTQFKMNIEKIDFSGDWELNNLIRDSLKKYKTNEGKKYTLKINTIYTKNSTTKDGAGNTATYQIDIDTNINVTTTDLEKNFFFKEKFTMENFSDELSQKNYESSNKLNVANSIVNKLMMQMLFLQ